MRSPSHICSINQQMSPSRRATTFIWFLLVMLLLTMCPVTLTTSPLHEQVCGSVLSGEVGVKNSLRLTEPVSSRFHTFHCDITFEPPTINSLRTSNLPSSSSSSSPGKHEYLSEASSFPFAPARDKLGISPEASKMPATVAASPSPPAASSFSERQSTGPLTMANKKATTDAINGAKDNSLMMGDVIELTFLSFQVGSFELTKDNKGVCSKGHLTIRETSGKISQGNSFASPSNFNDDSTDNIGDGRFCGQMMSRKAVYYSNANSSVTLSVYLPPGNPFFGHSSHFSLFLIYKFVSSKSLDTLQPSVSSRASSNGPADFTLKSSHDIHEAATLQGQRRPFSPIHHQNSSRPVSSSTSNSHEVWSVYGVNDASYDALEEHLGTKLNSQQAHLHLHPWNSKSNCDVIFDSCVPPKVCTILSPNFPGFYLRNVTCNYWFRESNVPSGYKGYYILQSKPNDQSISLSPVASSSSTLSQPLVPASLLAGDTSTTWSNNGSLLFDMSLCSSFDSITVYSGRNPSNSSAIIARFCSNGKLPLIITPISSVSSTSSSRDGMVIVFKSTSNSLLFDSRFQLSVQTILIPSTVTGSRSNISPTEVNLTGSTRVTTALYTHSMSPPFSASCDMTIDDTEQTSAQTSQVTESPSRRSGVIPFSLLDFHMPVTVNSSCTLRFISKRPTDRIWLSLVPTRVTSSAVGSNGRSVSREATTGGSDTDADLESTQCLTRNSYQIFGSLIRMQMPVTRSNASSSSLQCVSPTIASTLTPASDAMSRPYSVTDKSDLTSSTAILDLCERSSVFRSSRDAQHECSWHTGFLSEGASVTLKKTFRSNPALFAPFVLTSPTEITSVTQLASKLLPVNGYTVKYEFIDLKEYGDPVANSVCDRIIKPSSGSSLKGVVASSRNTFLYARGSGRRHLSCSYELTNEQRYMIKLHFTSIRLSSQGCTSTIDPTTHMYTCTSTSSPFSPSNTFMSPDLPAATVPSDSQLTLSTLKIFDSISSDRSHASTNSDASVNSPSQLDMIQIGCLCSSPGGKDKSDLNQHQTVTQDVNKAIDSDLIESSLLRDSLTFEAIGPSVIINFTVLNMQPDDDFVRFGFHARYEYISPRHSSPVDTAPVEDIHADISESEATSSRGDHFSHESTDKQSVCSSGISLVQKHPSHGHLLVDKVSLSSNLKPNREAFTNYPTWFRKNNAHASAIERQTELHLGDLHRIKCRYLITSLKEDSHLFLQFPLFTARGQVTSQVDCGSRDGMRVYIASSTSHSDVSDQQVSTWVPLKTFCLKDASSIGKEDAAEREESLRESSIIIKPRSLGGQSSGLGDKATFPTTGDSSTVKVILEVISHDNESRQESRSISGSDAVVAASWLEVANQINCPTLCPEVGGCISLDLWCDGIPHCPSALDEANCDHSQMHSIITPGNEATLLSSTGRDTSNPGVKSSVSNSTEHSTTSILTLVLCLIASLILIASVLAVTAYVIKSSDLRRRIRRAKAALDSNRNSSASAASSAASFSSSHYSFNFPRLATSTAVSRHTDHNKLPASVTMSRQLRQPILSMHTGTSGRGGGGGGGVGSNVSHGNLITLEGSSAAHRINGSKDLSPLVISSLNTSIDTNGTSSNNSSCSSSGGVNHQAPSHLYHRPSTLFRSNASALYSTSVTGATSPLIPSAFTLNQSTGRADVTESFMPSEKEFDYRSFVLTPSFTSSSRTCSRSSSKGSNGAQGYMSSKSKMKNVTRKHKANEEEASQLELLMQQSTGPLVPSTLASCQQSQQQQPSLTFRSSRIMTLGQPGVDRSRGGGVGHFHPMSGSHANTTASPVNGPYAAYNLYEDINDIKVTSSSSVDDRSDDCLASGGGSGGGLTHQLSSHFARNACNDGHKLHGNINDDISDRNNGGNIINVNDAMLEGSLGVNLHQAKTSSHYTSRRNVY